jgi:LysM repeat protein
MIVLARGARGLMLVAGCATLEVLAWRLTSGAVPTARAALDSNAPLGARGIGALLTALAAVLLLLAWSWLSCATVLVVSDVLRHQPRPGRPRRGIPAGWQRTVGALLGAGALCIPGAAVADGPGKAPDGSQPEAASIDGLPLPDRPSGTGRPAPLTHRVVAGQSLWAIARAHLAPDATSGRIAAEWPRWYAANAAVIGDDPDLIKPGTLLRAPAERAPLPQDDHLAAGTDPARTDGGPR